jgi:uncharacterized protein
MRYNGAMDPEKMAEYRRTARRRYEREQAELDRRFARGWEVAREAAVLLKEEFGAQRVAVFGSLTNRKLFHPRSDIDLAVWGIEWRPYLQALGQLLALDPDFSVDLVMVEEASAPLRTTIEQDGVVL